MPIRDERESYNYLEPNYLRLLSNRGDSLLHLVHINNPFFRNCEDLKINSFIHVKRLSSPLQVLRSGWNYLALMKELARWKLKMGSLLL